MKVMIAMASSISRHSNNATRPFMYLPVSSLVCRVTNPSCSSWKMPLGVVLAATDPVALDLVALRLMGFDENRIPKVREALAARAPRLFSASGPGDVRVREIHVGADAVRERTLDEIHCEHAFTPHPGWPGHVERSSL